MNKAVSTFQGFHKVKFYFISILIFLSTLGFVYRDAVTMTVQNVIFEQVRFRECRDILGLEKEFDRILTQDTVISRYGVYLYQPINHAFYKKVILTNSDIIKGSPSLQGVYLKDQPYLNQRLQEDSYYLITSREANDHPELRYIIDLDPNPLLMYSLKVNGKVIGEIGVRFKHPPSVDELETVMKDLSPLLYKYII